MKTYEIQMISKDGHIYIQNIKALSYDTAVKIAYIKMQEKGWDIYEYTEYTKKTQ